MKTQMLSAQRPEDIAAAAGLLRNGKLVAIPTETVYGLGANGLDENAVLRIFEAKGRPQDNPLILHISEPKELESICHDIPAQAWLLAEHFWPGPLTMVLPVRDLVPKRTTAGLDTVAVRCPKTAATRELIRLAGVPIAAPSANRSGKPSTTTAARVSVRACCARAALRRRNCALCSASWTSTAPCSVRSRTTPSCALPA